MALGRAYIEIIGDVKKFAPDLKRGLNSALKVGALSGLAVQATSSLVSLAGALAQVGGAAFAIPAAAGVYGAAMGALRIATSGLGDAMGAVVEGDAKAFEKALENLSPQAQKLAREFKAVGPAIEGVRTATQDAFAAPMVGQIQQTASVLAGPLRTGLAGIAAEYGNVARRALEFAREGATVSVLRGVP